MIWLYRFFDVATTIAEVAVTYSCVLCFCPKSKDYKNKKIRYILPFICGLFTIYLLTWFVDVGVYKPIIYVWAFAIIAAICYKTSIITTSISSMISTMMVMAMESGAITLFQIITQQDDLTVMVNGEMFMGWQVYLIGFCLKTALLVSVHKIFAEFAYQFNWKDFLFVLFDYAVINFVYLFNYEGFFAGKSDFYILAQHVLFIVLIFGTVFQMFYLKNFYYLRNKAKQDKIRMEQLQMQYAYYRDKQQEEEKVRSIYHDLKNHLLVLQSQTGNSQSVQNSVAELNEQMAEYANYYRTGNDFLDIIIRDKAKVAREKQIDFSVIIHFEAGAFIEPLDISTIFGNALDNAIEASEKLPIDKRMITVKAACIRDMLIITVENNRLNEQNFENKTTKEDKFLHGFGLSNIKKAVEKYGGSYTANAEKDVFKLKIVIPVSE